MPTILSTYETGIRAYVTLYIIYLLRSELWGLFIRWHAWICLFIPQTITQRSAKTYHRNATSVSPILPRRFKDDFCVMCHKPERGFDKYHQYCQTTAVVTRGFEFEVVQYIRSYSRGSIVVTRLTWAFIPAFMTVNLGTRVAKHQGCNWNMQMIDGCSFQWRYLV